MTLPNILTVDVEDWYHTQDLNLTCEEWDNCEERIVKSTRTVLNLLAAHHTKATFFVLGCVAEKSPNLIREIEQAGHEIGSHGDRHKMVCCQSREEFRADVVRSKKLLEDLTGKEVNLFRAPSWSISRSSLWALEVLEEEGFVCDSSIQPFRTPLSGMWGVPLTPYHPIVGNRTLSLLEFPPLPCGGGFYLRLFPQPFLVWVLKIAQRRAKCLIYTHPWETDTTQPRLKVSPLARFTHYYNLCSTVPKLTRLLGEFEFGPLGEAVKAEEYPAFVP